MPTNLDTAERRAKAAKAAMKVLDDGYTITGVRMSDPDNAENGYVVTFEPGEAEKVAAAIRKVIDARSRAAKK